MSHALAAAYSAAAGSWQQGAGLIYDRLAEVLVAQSPVPLWRSRVVDVGAGTGAATRAVLAAGAAAVVAVDVAFGMLAWEAGDRPPVAVGDALALPFAASAFDAAVAAFSLNHLTEPAAGLREMARVTRPGGALIAASYGADDHHPVRAAVEDALAARGWTPEPWYLVLRHETTTRLAVLEHGVATAADAGLEARVELVHVPFPDLDAHDLVAWRLGLAQHAPFVSRLSSEERGGLAADAVARLGAGFRPLVRSVLVLAAVRP